MSARSRRQALEARRRRLQARRKRARRWPWALLALLLLLLFLVRDCRCNAPPAEGPVEAPEAVDPVPVEPEPAPPTERMDPILRPTFQSPPPDPLPWLAAFRMQVAARGPRLAACFVGVERPGALKWSALVEPGSGTVSEHTLEPVLQSDALTAEQRACLLQVLSDPAYALDGEGKRATPSRVSIAISF